MKKNPLILTILGTLILGSLAAFLGSHFSTPVENVMGINCIECHRTPNINTNGGVVELNTFCLDCHTDKKRSIRTVGAQAVGLHLNSETLETLDSGPHQKESCLHCHADVARTPHKSQTGAVCSDCHIPHGEDIAHAPHTRVTCQACHSRYDEVMLDKEDFQIKLAGVDAQGMPIPMTDHSLADTSRTELCNRCHNKNNIVGAPAAILPSKSFLCVVCHNSPIAMGNPLFGAAALIFLVGILITLRFWFQGSVNGEKKSMHRKISLSSDSIWGTIFSRKFFSLLKIFFLDILLQRRILKESVQRWAMHMLIFGGILLRFVLSIFTGLAYTFSPDSGLVASLINKNNHVIAFTNDLLGLLILIGVLWAIVQRYIIKPAHTTAEIEDNVTIGLIGTLILFGFILEGARILVTQIPSEIAAYSFVGYPLSRIFAIIPIDWMTQYQYLWYIHALIGALFIAYLPFGKLRHVFNTPLTYFIEELSGVKNEKRV